MAQVQSLTRVNKDFQGWPDGVNSFLDPTLIKDTQARWAINAVCKGGMWQTRPGYKTILSMCLTVGSPLQLWWVSAGMPLIHPQMFTIFRPTGDGPYAVFAISGSVWFSPFLPNGQLGSARQITQLKFDSNVEQIVACTCIQSTALVAGRVVNIPPTNVLVIQDGMSRAGYWNGTTGAHLNPQNLWKADAYGNTIYQDGYNQTPIGKWMAWSGNRLWVFRGNQGWASDINNPLSFTETTVLTQVPVFNFPHDVTGCVDRGTAGLQNDLLFVFTEDRTLTLRSGIQDRTVWISTADFQKTIFNGVGCIAGKSIINHQGMLYWYSMDGVVSFDSTGTVYSSQSLPAVDYEMNYSKLRMSPHRVGICCGKHSSYVFWSVPIGPTINSRIYNGHTQVLDRMAVPIPPPAFWGIVAPYGVTSWQGVWTGINPIEWATDTFNGRPRTFCMSMDADGTPRIWEAFQGNRADNGYPIPWMVETKTHQVTESPFLLNNIAYFGALMDQVWGNVSVQGYWRGMRGPYKKGMDTFVTATPGSLLLNNPPNLPVVTTTPWESYTGQFRELASDSLLDNGTTGCQSDGVESQYKDNIDWAFSLLFKFTGVGALKAFRIASDIWQQSNNGANTPPETGLHILPEAACPEFVDNGTPPVYMMPDANPADALSPCMPRFHEDRYVAPFDPCP